MVRWVVRLIPYGGSIKLFHVSARVQNRGSEGRKEGNVLFNDAFNTFHLLLYGIGHMVNNKCIECINK